MSAAPLSVTQLSAYLKNLLDSDQLLSGVYVYGELSNYKIHSSGHHYFTLKDEGAVIAAVMFRSDASRLRFRPETGMKVLVRGRVSLFPKSGQYQIYVTDLQPDGAGALFVAFEQLKAKLQREGLFDPAHKKPLPPYPGTIALVTSPTGAAVRDMIRILNRRWPLGRVLVCPVKVQGENSGEEVAAMIRYVNDCRIADLIIAGRGGGSMEDLWAFNEEVVARAIYDSEIPIISAVGHEPDVTISDFVADRRAATPSNAAEIAVPDMSEIRLRLGSCSTHMLRAVGKKLSLLRARLDSVYSNRIFAKPAECLTDRRMHLHLLEQRLSAGCFQLLSLKRRQFVRLAASLDALSPLKVLGRGYLVAEGDSGIINSVRQLRPNQGLSLRFYDGTARCTVDQVEIQEKKHD